MSGLSTHVLDLTHGKPAAGVAVTLAYDGETWFEGVTNADGRCPGLLGKRLLARGGYRLTFAVAGYFRGMGIALPEPPFLDLVAIDFAVSDAAQHHHVPLLVSPYGYSTYRGS